jgi:pimeloyl-ACP methyl ester carboxylesterase
VQELAFDAHGSRVRWSETPGREPARVYVHGLGGTGDAAFGCMAGHPLLAGHRTLVIDLPGHGHSDRPSGWGYTLDGFADVVGAVIDATGAAEVDLVGHSMGGSIAIVVAARDPGRVRSLVVAEANLDPLPPSPAGLGSQRIAARTEADFVRSGYAHLVATDAGWRPTLRLCDPMAVHRSAVGLVTGSRPTMREQLLGLPIPRTFIRGERGEALARPETLEAAGVRIVTIPDAGHAMMTDAPEAFVRAVAEALGARSGTWPVGRPGDERAG